MYARWLRRQIRRVRRVIDFADITASRAAQNRLGELSTKVLARNVVYTGADGYPNDMACWAVPKECGANGAILYLHGGGYVSGSLAYAKLFGGVLAARAKARAFCLAYALAPEKPYPHALDDALEAYHYMLRDGISPGDITLAGESAGGGLAFCLAHKLKDTGAPLPARVVAISPWADLTLSGRSYAVNEHSDAALSHGMLAACARMYAPDNAADKYVSPIFGDFTGLPPALLFAGGDEMLLDDARAIKAGYDNAGGSCRLVVEKGMWHVYPLYNTAESRAAVALISEFIAGRQKEDV